MTGCRASGISVLWGTDFLCIQSGLPTAHHLIEARSPYPSLGTPASAIAAGKDINHTFVKSTFFFGSFFSLGEKVYLCTDV